MILRHVLSRLDPAAASIALKPVQCVQESIQTRATQMFYSSSVVIRVLKSLARPNYRLFRSESTGRILHVKRCRLSQLLPKSYSNRVGHLFLVHFDRMRRSSGRQCRLWVFESLLDPLRNLMALGQEALSETFQRGVRVCNACRYRIQWRDLRGRGSKCCCAGGCATAPQVSDSNEFAQSKVDAMGYSSANQKCAEWYENIFCFQFVKRNTTGGEFLLD